MKSLFLSPQLFFRAFMGFFVSAALMASFFVSIDSAFAEENPAPVAGSFGVGGDLTAGIDERTGTLGLQIPVIQLPGVDAGVNVALSYRQDVAMSGENPSNVGSGWTWGLSRVQVDNGVRVFTASGGVYEADESVPSGLAKYAVHDLVFRQKTGELPARTGIANAVNYAYTLEYSGGMIDYFDELGNIVARMGIYGQRTDWVWGDNNRLVAVVDDVGQRAEFTWTETGVKITAPPRSDGAVAETILEVNGDRLTGITDPGGGHIEFTYDNAPETPNTSHDGLLLKTITSSTGGKTQVSYQQLDDKSTAVDRVQTVDIASDEVLLTRKWQPVGEHTSTGWPTYLSQDALRGSADSEYQYQTELSDGATRLVSHYNSLGLMLSREIVSDTSAGDVTVQEQDFTYLGGETVPDPQNLPPQYAKPIQTSVVFRNSAGRERTVTEQMEYNTLGQLTRHVDADGTETRTVYDTSIPEGKTLPTGMVLENITTGSDGTVSKTVNTPTVDKKAIHTTETFTGTDPEHLTSISREEMLIGDEGFITEHRSFGTATTSSATANAAEPVITRFNRKIDPTSRTATVSETHAADTSAQYTTSTTTDLVTHLPIRETDPVGRVTTTTYDRVGKPLTHTDPAQHTQKIEYGDRVTRVTNPQNITRSEYVDAIGRVTKITDNLTTVDGTVTPQIGYEHPVETRKYENNSSKITVIDAQGLKTETATDIFGRPTRVSAPTGLTQIFNNDDVANTITTATVDTPDGDLTHALRETTTRKDNQGRDVSVTGARQDKKPIPEETTSYDGLGRVTSQTSNDVNSRIAFASDGTPRTTTLSPTNPDFAGEPVTANRDFDQRFGVATKKTLTQGTQSRPGVSDGLDAAGRTVSQTDQAGNITRYVYAPDGLVVSVSDGATGVETHNTYDPATRALTLTETTDANKNVTRTAYEYDPVTGETVAVFDPSDRVGTEISYTYDVFGNITQTRYPDGKTVTHTFDENNRHLTTTDIAGNITQYEYDDHTGIIKQVVQVSPQNDVLAHVAYEYDSFGRVKKLVRDDQLETQYSFTSADEVATETTKQAGKILFDAKYTYDSHGNLVKDVTTRPNDTETLQPVTETTLHSYDAFNRLTSTTKYSGGDTNGEPSERITYENTLSGDVAKETFVANGNSTVREFEYNTRGHLTAITTNGIRAEQKYDEAGNLVRAADGTQYTYNVYNQPVTETHPDGTRVENGFWITGQYKTITAQSATNEQTANSEQTGMYWDGSTLINDTHVSVPAGGEKLADDNSVVTASYLMGVSRYARTLIPPGGSADTNYYITDRHGNTVAMVSAQNVKETYTYADYGQTAAHEDPTHTSSEDAVAGAERNPFQYAGEFTTPTGLQLLGKRAYDPSNMRFTTQDTAAMYNLYAYANANPITMVDPTGFSAKFDGKDLKNGLWSGIGFLFGALGVLGTAVAMGGNPLSFIFTMFAGGQAIVTNLQSVDQYAESKKDLLTDKQSEILTWANLAVGGLLFIAGAGILGAGEKVAASAEEAAVSSEEAAGTISVTEGSSGMARVSGKGITASSFKDLPSSATSVQTTRIVSSNSTVVGYDLTNLPSQEATNVLNNVVGSVKNGENQGIKFVFSKQGLKERVGVFTIPRKGEDAVSFYGKNISLTQMPETAMNREAHLIYSYDPEAQNLIPHPFEPYDMTTIPVYREEENALIAVKEVSKMTAQKRFDNFMKKKGVAISYDTLTFQN